MQLLNKGLKYNVYHKAKNLLQTLAMQADTEIKQLTVKEENYVRQLLANNLQKLLNKQK
jgi:hypothetical protein